MARILGKISSLGPCSETCPSETMMISSARLMIRSWWEMMSSVALRLSWMALKVSVSLAKDHRSMPASGSSKIIRPELRARMVAISMRLTSPPDREESTSRSM